MEALKPRIVMVEMVVIKLIRVEMVMKEMTRLKRIVVVVVMRMRMRMRMGPMTDHPSEAKHLHKLKQHHRKEKGHDKRMQQTEIA